MIDPNYFNSIIVSGILIEDSNKFKIKMVFNLTRFVRLLKLVDKIVTLKNKYIIISLKFQAMPIPLPKLFQNSSWSVYEIHGERGNGMVLGQTMLRNGKN